MNNNPPRLVNTHAYEALLEALPSTIPDPDPEVKANGSLIFSGTHLNSRHMEAWITQVRLVAGDDVRIDWYYRSGRVFVDALGDLRKARAAILQTRPLHDYFFSKENSEYSLDEKTIAGLLYNLWKNYYCDVVIPPTDRGSR